MSQITQKGSTGALSLQAGGSFVTSSDPNLNTLLGTRWDLSDGREVILVSAGATTISTSGLLCQDIPIVSNHQGLAVTSFTAYSSSTNLPDSMVATLGATGVATNQYQGGFVLVDSGPGIGQTLRIQTNGSAAASGTIAIVLEDSPNTDLTTSSTICLLPPHGANVVVFPTTPTGAAVGVTLYPLTSGTTATPNVGFLTSKGITAMISDAAVATVGQSISMSVGTAGAGSLASGTGAVIGYAVQTAVSAKARAVFVNL